MFYSKYYRNYFEDVLFNIFKLKCYKKRNYDYYKRIKSCSDKKQKNYNSKKKRFKMI